MEKSVVWIQTMASLPYWPAYVFDPEELPEDQIGLHKSLVMLNKRQTETSPNRKYAVYMYGSGLFDFVKASQILNYIDKRDELVNQVVSDSFTNLFRQAISIANTEITLSMEKRLSWVISKKNIIQVASTSKSLLSTIASPLIASASSSSSSSSSNKEIVSSISVPTTLPLPSYYNSSSNNINIESSKVSDTDLNKDKGNKRMNDDSFDHVNDTIDTTTTTTTTTNNNNTYTYVDNNNVDIVTSRSIRRNRLSSSNDIEVNNVERKEMSSITNKISDRKYNNNNNNNNNNDNNSIHNIGNISIIDSNDCQERPFPGIDSTKHEATNINRKYSFEINSNNYVKIINSNLDNEQNIKDLKVNKDRNDSEIIINMNSKAQSNINDVIYEKEKKNYSNTIKKGSTEIYINNNIINENNQLRLNYGRHMCPFVSFGFGGKLAVYFPNTTINKISILNTIDLVKEYSSNIDKNDTISTSDKENVQMFIRDLCIFPSNLLSIYSNYKENVTNEMNLDNELRHYINLCMDYHYNLMTSFNNQTMLENKQIYRPISERLLWKLLLNMINYGVIEDSNIHTPIDNSKTWEDRIMHILLGLNIDDNDTKNENCTNHIIDEEVINEDEVRLIYQSHGNNNNNNEDNLKICSFYASIEALLLLGRKKYAAKLAAKNQEWSLALLLSGDCCSEQYQKYVLKYANSYFPVGSPLNFLCLIYTNQARMELLLNLEEIKPSNSKEDILLTLWRRNLAAIISNKDLPYYDKDIDNNTSTIEYDSRDEVEWISLCSILGDRLLIESNDVYASHFSYLCSGELPMYSNEKYTLLGLSKLNNEGTSSSSINIDIRTLMSIRMTEILEYIYYKYLEINKFDHKTKELLIQLKKSLIKYRLKLIYLYVDYGLIKQATIYALECKNMIHSLSLVDKNQYNIDLIDILLDRIEPNGYWSTIIYEDITINENSEQDNNLNVSSYSLISLDSYDDIHNTSNHSIKSNSSFASPKTSVSPSVGLQLSPNNQQIAPQKTHQNSVNSKQISLFNPDQVKTNTTVLNLIDLKLDRNAITNCNTSNSSNISNNSNICQEQHNQIENRFNSSSISSVTLLNGYPTVPLVGPPILSRDHSNNTNNTSTTVVGNGNGNAGTTSSPARIKSSYSNINQISPNRNNYTDNTNQSTRGNDNLPIRNNNTNLTNIISNSLSISNLPPSSNNIDLSAQIEHQKPHNSNVISQTFNSRLTDSSLMESTSIGSPLPLNITQSPIRLSSQSPGRIIQQSMSLQPPPIQCTTYNSSQIYQSNTNGSLFINSNSNPSLPPHPSPLSTLPRARLLSSESYKSVTKQLSVSKPIKYASNLNESSNEDSDISDEGSSYEEDSEELNDNDIENSSEDDDDDDEEEQQQDNDENNVDDDYKEDDTNTDIDIEKDIENEYLSHQEEVVQFPDKLIYEKEIIQQESEKSRKKKGKEEEHRLRQMNILAMSNMAPSDNSIPNRNRTESNYSSENDNNKLNSLSASQSLPKLNADTMAKKNDIHINSINNNYNNNIHSNNNNSNNNNIIMKPNLNINTTNNTSYNNYTLKSNPNSNYSNYGLNNSIPPPPTSQVVPPLVKKKPNKTSEYVSGSDSGVNFGVISKVRKKVISYFYPDAHDADDNMGSSGLNGYYDYNNKKWIIPGEVSSIDSSIGPPPIISYSNNDNDNNRSYINNSNNINDPLEALMATHHRSYPSIPHSLSLPSFTNTIASSLFQPKKVMKDGSGININLWHPPPSPSPKTNSSTSSFSFNKQLNKEHGLNTSNRNTSISKNIHLLSGVQEGFIDENSIDYSIGHETDHRRR